MKYLFFFISLTTIFYYGCSEDSDDNLSVEEVMGSYNSTVFNYTTNDTTFDLISEGASITIILNKGFTTTGHFFVPGEFNSDTVDIDLTLDGTFTIDKNYIEFQQDADTFIRDAQWLYQEGSLSCNYSKSNEQITVRLKKQ